MKTLYLITLLLFFVTANISQTGPTCPPKGITTEPGNAVNNESPNHENNTFFNWYDDEFEINSSKFPPAQTTIKSPFNSDAQNFNVDFLADAEDFKAEGGWELMSWDFGYEYDGTQSSSPTGCIHFILYNKYSSTIRVFAAGEGLQAYNSAIITLFTEQGNNPDPQKNAQPSIIQSPGSFTGLDKHYEGELKSVSEFYNIANNWIYADFFINYDPCVCLYESKVNYKVTYINTANVELKGVITGSVAQASSGTASALKKESSFSLDNVVAGYNKYKGLYDKGKDLSEIVSNIEDIWNNKDKVIYLPTFSQVQNNTWGSYWGLEPEIIFEQNYNEFHESTEPLYGLFEAGIKMVPYVGQAFEIIKFFVDATKKDKSPTVAKSKPMLIDANVTLEGTISEEHSYVNKIMRTPGSLNSNTGDTQYPLYNEVLGVFNIIETPKIKIEQHSLYHNISIEHLDEHVEIIYEISQFEKFELSTNELKYTFNPVLDLDDKDVEIMGLLRFEIPIINEEGKEKVGIYETEMYPLNCLFNTSFSFGGTKEVKFKHDHELVNIYGNYSFFNLKSPLAIEESIIDEISNGFLLPTDYSNVNMSHQLIFPYHYPYHQYNLQNFVEYSWINNYERKYNIALKLFITIKLPNGEKAFFVQTYDLDQELQASVTKPASHLEAKPFIRIDDIQATNFPFSIDFLANNIVIADNVDLTTDPTKTINFKAFEEIIVLPGVELNPNINLEIIPKQGCYNIPVNVMLDESEVTSFCNSSTYTGIRSKSSKEPVNITNDSVSSLNFEFNLFPNPTNDDTWLTYQLEEDALINITLTDLAGKIIQKNNDVFQPIGDYRVLLNTNTLSQGTYICTIFVNGVPKSKILSVQ